MLVDSHVNLHAEQFNDEADALVARAQSAGVGAMLTICDQLENLPKVEAIAERHKTVWHSVGVHPHYADGVQNVTTDQLIQYATHAKAVAIGECGLDYYYNHSQANSQKKLLAIHIEAAQETGLPLIIHTREADDDMQLMLETAYTKKPFTPLMHCYTSGEKLARAALALGGYIAFSGIVTFKNAGAVRAIARLTPLNRLLIETDCPYLAPVPLRGKRNEPAYLPHIADFLAPLKEISPAHFAEQTSDNFFTLFSKADRGALGG